MLSEKEIQGQIIDLLNALGIFHWRNNTGMAKSGGRYIRYGYKGSSDIICIRKGKFIGIEVKDRKGKQSDDQKEFEKNIKNSGGIYILARSLDDVMQVLNKLKT